MKNEERIFSVKDQSGKIVKFKIRSLTNAEMEEADVEFSRAFASALMNKVPPRAKMERILRENGVWTEEDDKKADAKIDKLAEIEKKLSEYSDKDEEIEKSKKNTDEYKRLLDSADILRGEISALRREKNSYYSHTAESKASDMQRDYAVALVTTYADSGEKVWKSVKEFKEEGDANILFRVVYEYFALVEGVPSPFKDEEEKSEDSQIVVAPEEQKEKAETPPEAK